MHAEVTGPLRTADRALQVLQRFRARDEALTVTEIATSLGLHRSTASRLVSTLERRGFLERVTGEGVKLGPEAARLGRIAAGERALPALAARIIARLAERTGEAVTLAVPAGDRVLTVAEAPGRHFVSSRNWVGVQTHAHCAADGKVLLAFGALPVPAGQLERRTASTIVEPAALGRALDEVRRRGFAVARGELEEGLHGIAAPVRDAGWCVAAICISGPVYRLRGAFELALAPECIAAAAELERELDPEHGAGRVPSSGGAGP
jgi:DNA-binding IclR family transcriptional regulator